MAVRHYIDILSGTFMVRQLLPWFENITKRQVKATKIYFRDSGIFHTLLDLESDELLRNSVKLGASWEGFALEEVIRFHQVDETSVYFWATHAGAELDLLIFKGGKRLGFEFKYTEHPKFTKSMHIALQDLKLDFLTIIAPMDCDFMLDKNVRVVGLKQLIQKESNSLS